MRAIERSSGLRKTNHALQQKRSWRTCTTRCRLLAPSLDYSQVAGAQTTELEPWSKHTRCDNCILNRHIDADPPDPGHGVRTHHR